MLQALSKVKEGSHEWAASTWFQLYINLGQVYRISKQYDEAIKCFKHAHFLSSDSSTVYTGLGGRPLSCYIISCLRVSDISTCDQIILSSTQWTRVPYNQVSADNIALLGAVLSCYHCNSCVVTMVTAVLSGRGVDNKDITDLCLPTCIIRSSYDLYTSHVSWISLSSGFVCALKGDSILAVEYCHKALDKERQDPFTLQLLEMSLAALAGESQLCTGLQI